MARLPNFRPRFMVATMNSVEIEHEALALPDLERGALAAKLLGSLPAATAFVSDDEVARRENDLATGKISAIAHAEFVRRVQRERGQ